MSNKLLLTLLFVLSSFSTHAQFDNLGLTEKLYNEVKQLNQFLERFNHREDVKGNPIEKSDPLERQQYIAALFDLEYIKTVNDAQKDSIRLFLNQVTSPKTATLLEYHQEDWFAEIAGVVQYKGKEHKLTLLMNVIGNKSKGFEWRLAGINAPFLESITSTEKDPIIPPNSNETNFMVLTKVFGNKESLEKLIAEDYSANNLYSFINAIEEGRLTWKYSQKISYHFLQIKDWVVQVDWYNRDSNNSGWLISKVIPFQEFLKAGYPQIILEN